VKTAAQAVRELVDELCPDVRIGMICAVHPAGRDLGLKFHVHLVMIKGGLKFGEWVEMDRSPGGVWPSSGATCCASTSKSFVASARSCQGHRPIGCSEYPGAISP
jgi:hypothetical protein